VTHEDLQWVLTAITTPLGGLHLYKDCHQRPGRVHLGVDPDGFQGTCRSRFCTVSDTSWVNESGDPSGVTSGSQRADPSSTDRVTEQDLISRTQEIMAEDDVSWKKAWPQAQSELGPADPSPDRRQRRGCLLGGLRLSFFVIVGFVTYLASVFLLALIPPVERCLSAIDGFVCAIPAMLLGALVAALLARRFQTISVILMASVVLVVGGTFVSFAVFQVASGPSEASIAAAAQHEDLLSALDRAVSMVSIPAEWEVQAVGMSIYSPRVGYKASPDLSSSGTWIQIGVTSAAGSDEGDSSEDAFWRDISGLRQTTGGQLADEPLETTLSGIDGYLYEVSGLVGERTGQELGAYIAIFFGPEYTYEVMVQFELPDRDDMSVLYRNTVTHLTLVDGDDEL